MSPPIHDPIELLKSILADEAVNQGWGLNAAHLDSIRTALSLLETAESGVSLRLAEVEQAVCDFIVKTDRVYAQASNHQADIRKLTLKDAMEAMNVLRRLMAPPVPAEMPLSTEDRAAIAELAKGLDDIATQAESMPKIVLP